MTYGLYSFEKNLSIFFKFLGSINKQKPTPQLNVLSISLSEIPFFLSQSNILKVLIEPNLPEAKVSNAV